ncbi:hypothetical protein LCGC14_1181150 [marine sediment metagenome]|uniref:CARDB domain-containing protein n=1 Tax=marine sediment metagenome TaxID=412755 RepID=A0A0F9PSJ8_9ZZZZ
MGSENVVVGAVLVGGAALAGGAMLLLSRAKAAPPEEQPPEEVGADIAIRIIDPRTGEPLSRNSPAILAEGTEYALEMTVTNTSTRMGSPVAASLTIDITGKAGPLRITFPPAWAEPFGPGVTVAWSFPVGTAISFFVPSGTGGSTGEIVVVVRAPNGLMLASDIEPLSIQSAEISYGANVTIGVI